MKANLTGKLLGVSDPYWLYEKCDGGFLTIPSEFIDTDECMVVMKHTENGALLLLTRFGFRWWNTNIVKSYGRLL